MKFCKSIVLFAALSAIALGGAGCAANGGISLPASVGGASISTSVSAGGASAGTTSTDAAAQAKAQTLANWQATIVNVQFGIHAAEAFEQTLCSVLGAPTFCTNAVDTAKIAALEKDVDDGLQGLSDALTAYQNGGSASLLTDAMTKLSLALADYTTTLAAFRSGKTS